MKILMTFLKAKRRLVWFFRYFASHALTNSTTIIEIIHNSQYQVYVRLYCQQFDYFLGILHACVYLYSYLRHILLRIYVTSSKHNEKKIT